MKPQSILPRLLAGLSSMLVGSHSGMPLAATTADSTSPTQHGAVFARVPPTVQSQHCALGSLGGDINRSPKQTEQLGGVTFAAFQHYISTGQDPGDAQQLPLARSASAGKLTQFAPANTVNQTWPWCSPDMEGQRTCINGWMWVCQCFSYGCNFMATSIRCN